MVEFELSAIERTVPPWNKYSFELGSGHYLVQTPPPRPKCSKAARMLGTSLAQFPNLNLNLSLKSAALHGENNLIHRRNEYVEVRLRLGTRVHASCCQSLGWLHSARPCSGNPESGDQRIAIEIPCLTNHILSIKRSKGPEDKRRDQRRRALFCHIWPMLARKI